MHRGPRPTILLLCGALGLACSDEHAAVDGGASDDGSGAASVGSSTDASGTSAMDTSGFTEASSSSTLGTSSEGSGDVDPPYPEECEEPEATIDVAASTSPEGPFTIDEAWFGVDFCSHTPYVELVQNPSRAAGPGIDVKVLMDLADVADEPYFGTYPAHLWNGGTASGTIEFLEPLAGLDPGTPNPENHLHARIEVHDEGWDLSLEVDLLDCGVAECFCPCR